MCSFYIKDRVSRIFSSWQLPGAFLLASLFLSAGGRGRWLHETRSQLLYAAWCVDHEVTKIFFIRWAGGKAIAAAHDVHNSPLSFRVVVRFLDLSFLTRIISSSSSSSNSSYNWVFLCSAKRARIHSTKRGPSWPIIALILRYVYLGCQIRFKPARTTTLGNSEL